jgi:hypothetical protein
MCDTPGKVLVIVGIVIGAIGIVCLGFAIWVFRRRRWSSASPTSNAETSSMSSSDVQKSSGMTERWWVKPSALQTSRFKSRRSPSKDSISKPSRLSLWPPSLWRRRDDRLSFKDAGGPSLPVAPYNNLR